MNTMPFLPLAGRHRVKCLCSEVSTATVQVMHRHRVPPTLLEDGNKTNDQRGGRKLENEAISNGNIHSRKQNQRSLKYIINYNK